MICGIQQVGVGVRDVESAWSLYRSWFGVDVPIFQDAGDAPLMTRYTGGQVFARTATLALNMQGGSGMEIWQFTNRTPTLPAFDVQLGDTGIYTTRIKCRDVPAAYARLKTLGADVLGDVTEDPAHHAHFFVRDPDGLVFQVVGSSIWFSRGKHLTGGPCGCMIGVSDVDAALPLYAEVLGFDRIVYDQTDTFDDLAVLPGGRGARFRRILLAHSRPFRGPFSQLFGPSRIELIQALDRTPRKIYENRFWGDPGFIHLCFDVQGMDRLEAALAEKGFPFTIDSKNSFDMGEASGRFSYIEDPDGTLIEFVETHRIPVIKKLGWHLDIRKRPPGKPLPAWILKALRVNRVRS